MQPLKPISTTTRLLLGLLFFALFPYRDAAGFAVTSPLLSPQDAVQRPVGIAQGPDGSLYVTADVGGKVWRIVYTGM